MAKFDSEIQQTAYQLWRQGLGAKEIYSLVKFPGDIKPETGLRYIFKWLDEWRKTTIYDPANAIFETDSRYQFLLQKPDKTALELEEFKICGDLLARFDSSQKTLAAVCIKRNRLSGGERPAKDKHDSTEAEEKPRSGKRAKNDVSEIMDADFEKFEQTLFWHQLISLEAAENPLTNSLRFILKPRQHGQTYVEAYTAFKRAVKFGENTAFMSSTIAQALEFKGYLDTIYKAITGSLDDLQGSKALKLSNGARFFFLSFNGNAQSRACHIVIDEFAHTPRIDKIFHLVVGMATQSKYTVTMLTTPSTALHPYNKFWKGDWYNDHQRGIDKVEIPLGLENYRAGGILCKDNIWRFRYDVHIAVEKGFDLVTIDDLRKKCPDPVLFANIYETVEVDDSSSVFRIEDILNCAVNEEDWPVYQHEKIACGYDPAGSNEGGDRAGLAFVQLPSSNEEAFYLREFKKFTGGTAREHIAYIENSSWAINQIYVDKSGGGLYVYDNVLETFPRAVGIGYNNEVIARMVQKMLDLVSPYKGKRRFFYHEKYKDEMVVAFMSVKSGFSEKTGQQIYYSSRTGANHGEAFWATAQVCSGHEGLVINKKSRFSVSVIN